VTPGRDCRRSGTEPWLENFTVTGVPRAGIRAVLNHHVTIRGNTGDLNGRWGILTGFSDDLLIENNVMSRSQAEHGIYVGNSGDRPVIRRNVVWGNRANGIHITELRAAVLALD
jgi:parallel beta-helix repeat protein